MGTKSNESELLQKILADVMPLGEERAAVDELAVKSPQAALTLLPVLVQQKHRYKAGLEEAKKANEEFVEKLRRPPWYPAAFLRFIPGLEDRALVATGDRRLAATVDPGVDPAGLHCGRSVFLSHDLSLLLAVAPDLPWSGSVGVFSRFHDGRVVLKGSADEELIVELAAELKEVGLKQGDLLLYGRESLVAWEAVEKASEQDYLLEEIPDVTFGDIGGLDEVIGEITSEIDLHFFHRELVEQHHLPPNRGILLWGFPGVGKTMLAKALANHLARLHGVEVTFFNVKPGIHRSMWYGQTEERIRELFRRARRAADGENRLSVMFFDDIDQLGARGDGGASTSIDSRVLPCFLVEMDGLSRLNRVLLVAATNRPDLLDEGLLRPGRFGEKAFRIPRPNRDAARQIFSKYLTPDLPYLEKNGDGNEAAASIIETALAGLYSPKGESHLLATLTFRDGSRRPLTAPEVMSGAFIANAAAEAKRRSCLRALRSGPAGITAADLLAAIDRGLSEIAPRLKPGPALRQMLDLSLDLDVVKVEVETRSEPRSYEYVH